MSLEVQQLTKVYGTQRAVNAISFSVRTGEIVGFLGPNGAGKSTTMKIATCFIPPSSGTVRVGGYDVIDAPMKVKQMTGYLPEHNPLYLDLYVHEYLQFVGKVYGLRGKDLRHRVGEMIELCGLTREQNKRIETLSKGYRQRVGLAQALLHDPAVLILDEPTSGLDPNQLVEIRKLISEVSREKTVLFSTHIMQEVQALCDRVIVINKGELVADASLSDLLRQHQHHRFIVEFEGGVELNLLRSIHGVTDIIALTPTTYRLITQHDLDIRAQVFRVAADNNLALVGLRQEENSLENIFHTLTQSPAEAADIIKN